MYDHLVLPIPLWAMMFWLPILPLALEFARQRKLQQQHSSVAIAEWFSAVGIVTAGGIACLVVASRSSTLLWLSVPALIYVMGGCIWGVVAARVFRQPMLIKRLQLQFVGVGLMLLVYGISLLMLTRDTHERLVVSGVRGQVLLETECWRTADAEVYRRDVLSFHSNNSSPSLLTASQSNRVEVNTSWFGVEGESSFPRTEEELRQAE